MCCWAVCCWAALVCWRSSPVRVPLKVSCSCSCLCLLAYHCVSLQLGMPGADSSPDSRRGGCGFHNSSGPSNLTAGRRTEQGTIYMHRAELLEQTPGKQIGQFGIVRCTELDCLPMWRSDGKTTFSASSKDGQCYESHFRVK